jgi:hypothetical protein
MLTPAAVAADLAADRTRTLLAEAEAYRLAQVAATHRPAEEPPKRWWNRSRTEPALRPSAGTA